MAIPDAVDLSHHNPDPDWAEVKQSGVVGVILKATESVNYVDPTLYKRGSEARKAGLKVATYHYLRPRSIARQMDHYLSTVDPVQGERMCLDHEESGVSISELEDAVKHLLSNRGDLQITIYSGHLIKDQLGNKKNEFLAANTSLWIAQYTTAKAPKWPKETWPAWSLWQYTDNAKVPGISKGVDGNRWNGSQANLIAWFGPSAVPAPEPSPVPPTRITVALAVPEGVEVEVTINGQPLN